MSISAESTVNVTAGRGVGSLTSYDGRLNRLRLRWFCQ